MQNISKSYERIWVKNIPLDFGGDTDHDPDHPDLGFLGLDLDPEILKRIFE